MNNKDETAVEKARVHERAVKTWKQQNFRSRLKYGTLGAVGLLSLIVLWQLLSSAGFVNQKLFPPPAEVFRTLIYKIDHTPPDGNVLLENILASLQVTLSGFCLAVVIGIPLGLIMGWWEYAERYLRPIFELARPIPPIAWIPLVVVWVGIGLKAKSLIIFCTAFVPCVINAYTGARLTNPTYVNVSKTFGASKTETFFKVCIPSAMPMVFTAIRVALGNAWATLVAAEMLAASVGLGYMIQMGRAYARPDIIIVGMIVIGFIGAILSGILTFLEKLALRWTVKK